MLFRKLFCLLTVLLGVLSINAQNWVLGSFYLKFQEPAKCFSQIQKQKGYNSSRQVEIQALLPSEPTITEKLQLYQPARYAYSMHIGQALDNCFRIDFRNVKTEQQNEVLYQLLTEQLGKGNVEKVPQTSILNVETGHLPNDPLLHLEILTGGWHLNSIGFDKIYGKYAGSPEIKVAVIDNAVWGEHPDLQIKPENQYFAYIEEEGNSAPPSNVSQTEQGESMFNNMGAEWSHGTHCAGLVAALSNNNEGIASFASGITLLSARAADTDPKSMVRPYECILWALDKGARVLSLSWGSGNPSETEREIIETAVRNGVVVVAAAGNDGKNTPIYPASYKGVISVGSVDSDFQRSDFSNYGDWVKIYAPGGFLKNEAGEITPTSDMILSTTYAISQQYHLDGLTEVDGLFYDGKIGTSMATPLVASVISLMLSVDPTLTPAEIEHILQTTATPKKDLPVMPGSGVINAAAAVESVAQGSGWEETITDINIYPNPASDWIVIQGNEPIRQIDIMDLNGRLCHHIQTDGNKINITQLQPGFYLIRVETTTGTQTARLVKYQ